jgi:hypothetical protein
MAAQPLNSAQANSKLGDWYHNPSYRTIKVETNRISSHGLHMKIFFCDVYHLPRPGKDRSDVRWVLAADSVGLMGELLIWML